MQEAGEWKPAIAQATLRTRTCAGVLARSRIAVLKASLPGAMLDSRFAITNTIGPAEKHRRGGRRGNRQLRLLVQPFGRAGIGRPRRAALRVDRARDGGNRRLGYADALRKTVV